MREYSNREKELLEKEKDDLWGKYTNIKNVTSEILKWTPPSDTTLSIPEPYYTDHGIEHSERILKLLDELTGGIELNSYEVFLLLSGVWLHDIGMFVGKKRGETPEEIRRTHHQRSADYVKEHVQELSLTETESNILQMLCLLHRRDEAINEKIGEKIPAEAPRTEWIQGQSLSALLRLADGCDITKDRAPETIFHMYEEFIPDVSKEFWKSHFLVNRVVPSKDEIKIYIGNFSDDQFIKKDELSILKSINHKLKNEVKSVNPFLKSLGFKEQIQIEFYNPIRGEKYDLNELEREIEEFSNKIDRNIQRLKDISGSRACDYFNKINPLPVVEEIKRAKNKEDLTNALNGIQNILNTLSGACELCKEDKYEKFEEIYKDIQSIIQENL